jgi:hypothetical protein
VATVAVTGVLDFAALLYQPVLAWIVAPALVPIFYALVWRERRVLRPFPLATAIASAVSLSAFLIVASLSAGVGSGLAWAAVYLIVQLTLLTLGGSLFIRAFRPTTA